MWMEKSPDAVAAVAAMLIVASGIRLDILCSNRGAPGQYLERKYKVFCGLRKVDLTRGITPQRGASISLH